MQDENTCKYISLKKPNYDQLHILCTVTYLIRIFFIKKIILSKIFEIYWAQGEVLPSM